MPTSIVLAEYSNLFVYAAMAVFTVAFFLFAITLAKRTGGSQEQGSREDTRVPAAVAAGASTASAGSSEVGLGAATGAGGKDSNPQAVSQSKPSSAAGANDVRGRKLGNIAFALTWLATGLLVLGIIARGISAGRPPIGNMYEFSLMIAVVAAVIFLVLSTKTDVRWLGVFVTGAVLLILGSAVTILYTDSAPLVPALKSYWLLIHVLSVIIASGAFTVGALVTVMYLIRDRAETNGKTGANATGLVAKLPAAERLDTMAYRIYAFTFPVWTFAVIAGAIWAEAAWGRYWGWDPKETWAFITWVVFAGYLHARATAGWSGRKAAVIALIGFATIIINYFIINFYATGLHSYAGV